MKNIYTILLLPILFIGCNETTTTIKPKVNTVPETMMMVGGACTYKDTLQQVKIIAIDEKKDKDLCKNSVVIKYELVEKVENLSVVPRGEIKYNLSKEYLIAKGFDINTIHILKISTIKLGTCTPTIEKLTDINISDFKKWCKEK
jgi:hypothetical protein